MITYLFCEARKVLAQIANLRLCALLSLRIFVCVFMSGFGQRCHLKRPQSQNLYETGRSRLLENEKSDGIQQVFFLESASALWLYKNAYFTRSYIVTPVAISDDIKRG